jgi:hypothetical protein
MSNGKLGHAFSRVLRRELNALDRKWRAENELLASAARGGPFYGVGKDPNAQIYGLTEFLPPRHAKTETTRRALARRRAP